MNVPALQITRFLHLLYDYISLPHDHLDDSSQLATGKEGLLNRCTGVMSGNPASRFQSLIDPNTHPNVVNTVKGTRQPPYLHHTLLENSTMKKIALFFGALPVGIFLFFLPLNAIGQVHPQGSLNLIAGFPQQEFNDFVDNVGFGGNLFLGLGFEGTPIVIGVDLGYMVYGFERRNEPFSTTIPDVTVDVETSNNIATGHFVLRLQAPKGPIQPYVDGLAGGKYFFTETRIDNEGWSDGHDPIAVSTNFDDWAWSYGVGGGVNIRLYNGPMGKDLRQGSVMMNVGLRYLYGGKADYLQKGSIRRENGEVFYTVDHSRTDMLLPQFGVTLAF